MIRMLFAGLLLAEAFTSIFTIPANDSTLLFVALTASGLVPDGYTLISLDAAIKGMIIPIKYEPGSPIKSGLATTSIRINPCY